MKSFTAALLFALVIAVFQTSLGFKIRPPQFLKPKTVATVGGTIAGILLGGSLLDSSHFLNFSPLPVDARPMARSIARGPVNSRQNADISVFQGSYDDPNHPDCLRQITAKGNAITIVGSDKIDGSNQWTLQATENTPGEMLVDFSPKGGPKDLLGQFDDEKNAIVWPDGNSWTKKA